MGNNHRVGAICHPPLFKVRLNHSSNLMAVILAAVRNNHNTSLGKVGRCMRLLSNKICRHLNSLKVGSLCRERHNNNRKLWRNLHRK